ncbi:MAG: hypothetical protein KFF73_00800 [Cyclobacteriaceae bacterium]|nr:hypothetical protein [Cyclobacteriaceae bacterium]
MKKISDVIPENKIILLSPHYDDAPLTFGGYLDVLSNSGLIQTKNICIVQIFSRSNYQARDDEGNRDTSLERIQFATGTRLLEDLNCLDDLLGHGNYRYEIKDEVECVIRQKSWKPGELFEFPHGSRETFDAGDWEIYENIKKYASGWLSQEDTAILLPLCIKEHIDHVILRDAVMAVRENMKDKVKAVLYFGEDQPYTGLADENDWKKAEEFLKDLAVERIDYPVDENRKVDVIWKHYPTQVEESYRQGILNRALQLKQFNHVDSGVERIYRIH